MGGIFRYEFRITRLEEMIISCENNLRQDLGCERQYSEFGCNPLDRFLPETVCLYQYSL